MSNTNRRKNNKRTRNKKSEETKDQVWYCINNTSNKKYICVKRGDIFTVNIYKGSSRIGKEHYIISNYKISDNETARNICNKVGHAWEGERFITTDVISFTKV